MSITTSTNRWVLTNSSGDTIVDTDRQTLRYTDAPLEGTLSFPAYEIEVSGYTLIDTDIDLGACSASATIALGTGRRTNFGASPVSFAIGGTYKIGVRTIGMLDDSINPRYITAVSGPSKKAGVHAITFFPSGGRMYCNHIVYLPQSGAGSNIAGFPSTVIDYQVFPVAD